MTPYGVSILQFARSLWTQHGLYGYCAKPDKKVFAYFFLKKVGFSRKKYNPYLTNFYSSIISSTASEILFATVSTSPAAEMM